MAIAPPARMENGMNGFHISRPLKPGVYVPTPCFFHQDTEDVDTETVARHAVRLAKAGVAGLATQGSNGEAVHLNHAERRAVTKATRKALDEAGFTHMPLIVGCGAQSTHETVELCREARNCGGDYAMVLPPSYYAGWFTPNSQSVVDYFTAVADQSPIPIIIYNYPGAAGGIDLSSDIICALAAHPNITGVKLTCGNTGKLNRIAATTRERTKNYNPAAPAFLVLAGSADFTIQSLVAGSHGILAGLANITPKACVRTVELFSAHQNGDGSLETAQAMQEVLSRGDWVVIRGGVVGTKAGLQGLLGYGGFARHPLPKPSPQEAKQWAEELSEIWKLEESL